MDTFHDWYKKTINNFSVDHPASVGNTSKSRKKAIKALIRQHLSGIDTKVDSLHVLDVGAGNGLLYDALIEVCKKHNIHLEYTAVEDFDPFKQYLEGRGIKVLSKIPKKGRYDYVYMLNMFEGQKNQKAVHSLITSGLAVSDAVYFCNVTIPYEYYLKLSIDKLMREFDLDCTLTRYSLTGIAYTKTPLEIALIDQVK